MGALFKNEGVLGKVLPLQRKIIWERLDSPVSPPNGIFDKYGEGSSSPE